MRINHVTAIPAKAGIVKLIKNWMPIFIGMTIIVLSSLPAFASDKEPNEIYKRVIASRTLKCSYTIYPSFFEKDPATGKFSGLSYDIMEEIGKQIGFKIIWTEEVGTDAVFQGLGTRYDANCIGYFSTPARALGGDFTKPFMFLPYNLYVRADEKRFKSLENFNSADVTISTLDGELSQTVAAEQFPKAKNAALPGLTAATDRFMAVATGKADATPMEASIGAEYMKANPGKIKQFGDKPLQVGGSVIIIPHDEFRLKRLLDVTIDTMLWTGALERIIKKHEKYPGTIFLPVKDYRETK